MKKPIITVLFAILANCALAATHTVDGIEWTYTVSNGKASLGGGSWDAPAISTSTTGAIIIPSTLDGLPVTSIRNSAFYYCSGLTSVTIPDSVTSIGGEAFLGCSGLTSVTIGDSVTSIGWGAFYGCSGLTSVTIPDSVTSIGGSAFNGCSGLTSVTIPDSVTSIDSSAFNGCSGLTSFVVSEMNPSYCSKNGLLLSKDGKTLVCGVNGDVTIPDSVTSIGDEAFDGCSGLTSVTIPDSVTSIGDWAFYGCSGLTSVTIPDSVTSIRGSAFNGCSDSLFDTATIPGVKLVDGWAVGHTDSCSGNLDLTGVRGIGDYAFENCSGLRSVTIGDSVTSIGGWVFSDCSGLTSVTIPDSVTSIGYQAFFNCSGLTSVTIPDSVTSIGDYAFEDCCGLTSVTIGDSVTSIGEDAFHGCSGLTSVTIPNSVTSIGDWAFEYCSGLTSVTIGTSVTSIGKEAFYGCSGLTSVSIPSSVVEIGEDAFKDTKLEKVYVDVGDTENVKALLIVSGYSNIRGITFIEGKMPITPTPVNPQPDPAKPSYEVIEVEDIVAAYDVPKATVLKGVVYGGDEVVGIIELKLGKVNAKKHSGKVSGSVTTLDGKKHTIKSANITGIDGMSAESVSLGVKDMGTMEIRIGGAEFAGSMGAYHVQSGEVGGAWSGSGATVMVEAENVSMFAGAVLDELLPMPEVAKVAGGKWKFAKATTVKWAKPKKGAALPELYDEATGKGLIVDEAGGKTNRSAMKLTYTPKKGTFKGSFKVYALEGEGKARKLKKYKVNVSGLVVGGVGHGTATCKKPAAKWSVTVK